MFGSILVALWPRDGTLKIQGRLPTPVIARSIKSRGQTFSDEVWLVLVPVGLVLSTMGPVSGVLVALCGPAMWWFRSRQRLAKDLRAKRDALPEVLDLVAVSLGAGITVSGALRLARSEAPVAVRSGFTSVLALSEAGVPLERALPKLFDELGESYNQLVTALVASVRDGAPLTDLLNRLGDNARISRRLRAEERGRRLPVVIMFPLSVCSMPAVLIGTIVPVIIVGLRSTSF